MNKTVRITKAMREEIVRLYREYDRSEVRSEVRVLTAIENGRVERDGAQTLALSPEEGLALAGILDYCMEEWRCGLDYSRSIGEFRTRQRLLEQAEDIALRVSRG